MDWKGIAGTLAKVGLPLIGAALPLPGGAAIGTALAAAIGAKDGSPDAVLEALTLSPEARQKAAEFQAAHTERLMAMTIDAEKAARAADSSDMAVVNATMQAEAVNGANENWWQKGWRPFNGYVVGLGSLISTIYTCVLFGQAVASNNPGAVASIVAIIPSLAMSIATILAVPGAAVGITAWHRGRMQREQITGPAAPAAEQGK